MFLIFIYTILIRPLCLAIIESKFSPTGLLQLKGFVGINVNSKNKKHICQFLSDMGLKCLGIPVWENTKMNVILYANGNIGNFDVSKNLPIHVFIAFHCYTCAKKYKYHYSLDKIYICNISRVESHFKPIKIINHANEKAECISEPILWLKKGFILSVECQEKSNLKKINSTIKVISKDTISNIEFECGEKINFRNIWEYVRKKKRQSCILGSRNNLYLVNDDKSLACTCHDEYEQIVIENFSIYENTKDLKIFVRRNYDDMGQEDEIE